MLSSLFGEKMEHKLIMESWRKCLKEWGAYGHYGDEFMGRKISKQDQERIGKAQAKLNTWDGPSWEETKQSLADIVTILEPTGQVGEIDAKTGKITPQYELVQQSADAANLAWEKGEYLSAGLNSAAAVLGALAMIPIIGKIPKLLNKGVKLTKVTSKAKQVSAALRKTGNKQLIAKADEIDVVLSSKSPLANNIDRNYEYAKRGLKTPSVASKLGRKEKKAQNTLHSKVTDKYALGYEPMLDAIKARPRTLLSKYRFTRVKPEDIPKEVFHGSPSPTLNVRQIDPLHRPRKGNVTDPDWKDAAGFYTHTNEWAPRRYARGPQGTVHKFEVNPNANVFKYKPKGDEYYDGWHFIRLSSEDVTKLRKKGVDALYDTEADEFIIIATDPSKVLKKVENP